MGLRCVSAAFGRLQDRTRKSGSVSRGARCSARASAAARGKAIAARHEGNDAAIGRGLSSKARPTDLRGFPLRFRRVHSPSPCGPARSTAGAESLILDRQPQRALAGGWSRDP